MDTLHDDSHVFLCNFPTCLAQFMLAKIVLSKSIGKMKHTFCFQYTLFISHMLIFLDY
jgi:hypothetical protein